jgi:hypothetical protein
MTPWALCYSISTRRTETTLKAWFDEVLPYTFVTGRPEIDDFEILWPRVIVWPMFAWKGDESIDPDWLTDSRVLGRAIELPAKDGAEGLAALLGIRRRLERELRDMPCSKG